jgi:hypothetical protein
MKRPPFVKSKDPPHEKRFDPAERTIDSPILSKTRKKNALDFNKQLYRDPELIKKGGNEAIQFNQSETNDINPNKDIVLERQFKGYNKFDKLNKSAYVGSIYMKEYSPDYYDDDLITAGFKKTSDFKK